VTVETLQACDKSSRDNVLDSNWYGAPHRVIAVMAGVSPVQQALAFGIGKGTRKL
jgi:hypothetical protein